MTTALNLSIDARLLKLPFSRLVMPLIAQHRNGNQVLGISLGLVGQVLGTACFGLNSKYAFKNKIVMEQMSTLSRSTKYIPHFMRHPVHKKSAEPLV